MNGAPDERTRRLIAAAARQRGELAASLAPWRTRAQRLDRTTQWVRSRAGWLGFAAGAGVGLLAALRPRFLVASARALAASWPLWRRVGTRR